MARKKPADQRQNRNTSDTVVELVPGGLAPAPEAPGHWLDETRSDWSLFWADEELVSVVRDAHRPSLVQMFEWRDKMRLAWAEAEVFRAAVGGDHLVRGSTGQMVANPLYALADKAENRAIQMDGKAQALAEKFGLTPASLLSMGVDFQRRQNLEAQNSRLTEALATRSGDASQDPRSLPGDTAEHSA